MTRRITLTILATVWLMLIAGSATAYFTTRTVLLKSLDQSLQARATALPQKDDRYVVRTDLGQTTASSANPSAAPVHSQIIDAAFTHLADGTRLRTVTLRLITPAAATTVTYSTPTDQFDHILNTLALALSACCLIGGLAAAALARRATQIALRPLHHTADIIGNIDQRHLDRRIDAERLPPELVPMANRLNGMLARLQAAFDQRRQFLGDASHELRTPVAALITNIEVTLRRDRNAADYRTALDNCLTDAKHLKQLVERLMEQVRSETLTHDEPATLVDVSQVLDECADMAASLGQDRGITVIRDFPKDLTLTTPTRRFRSIVTNLVSNAVEYNRPGGKVEIHCEHNGHGFALSVRDTGIGISPEQLPSVFQPFFRADQARQRDSGHLGLGLALVKAHVDAVGGECTVKSEKGVGTVFEVRLPEQCLPQGVEMA